MAQSNYAFRTELEDRIKKLESDAAEAAAPKPDEVKLTAIDYTPPSDKELKARAEAELSDYRAQNVKKITDGGAQQEKALGKKRDGYEEALASDMAALGAAYERAAQEVDNDVLKRGLARSSIAVNQKADIERDRAAKAADTEREYGKKIAELDGEIAAVSGNIKSALDDFNLAYAVKLTEKLNKLKSERDAKLESVVKYNNDVKVKQASLDAARIKTESQLSSQNGLDRLSADDRDALYGSVYDAMDAYLDSLSASEAKLEIRNHTLYRNHLSDHFYYKLYDKYGR